MPARPPRACTHFGCRLYSYTGSSYCETHTKPAASGWKDYKKGKTASQNGYGSRWRKLRESVMIRDRHLCQPCYKLGLFTRANEVDHIINKASGGTDDMSNLQAICRDCHKRKTLSESKAKNT